MLKSVLTFSTGTFALALFRLSPLNEPVLNILEVHVVQVLCMLSYIFLIRDQGKNLVVTGAIFAGIFSAITTQCLFGGIRPLDLLVELSVWTVAIAVTTLVHSRLSRVSVDAPGLDIEPE
jgi:hypothetical protein